VKNILIINYSQSGQLDQIIDQFIIGLGNEFEIDRINYFPAIPYPFPWTTESFFAVMPDSVSGVATSLQAINFSKSNYDLIIFGYQPWYLSPSIPATSLFENKDFQNILPNTPIITIIGARNMWLNAQEKMKLLINRYSGKLVGNVTLVDKHNNYASAVSILQWMLSGKKERYKGIFPLPGISDKDIADASTFGAIVSQSIKAGDITNLQKKIVQNNGVYVDSNLMFIEHRAGRLFKIWATVINSKSNKKPWLNFFKYYLLVALFFVAPIVLLFYKVLAKPFLGRRILKKKNYYLGIS
jgi:hypothetical protein